MNINFEIIPKYIKSEYFIINLIIDDLLKNKNLLYTFDELNIPELKGSHFLFLERFIKKGFHTHSKRKLEYLCLLNPSL